MDKKLEQVIKSVSDLIKIKASTRTVGTYFHHIPVSKDEEKGIEKYAKNTLEELIYFVRIEKMCDSGIIDNYKKEELYKDYNKYQKLGLIIGSYFEKKFIAECEGQENQRILIDDSIMKRYKYLEDKLTSYSVITNFNYEDAIMNQVDNEVNKKMIIKKKK